MYWAIGILTVVFLIVGICGMGNTKTPQEKQRKPYDQEQDNVTEYRVHNRNGNS